MTAILEINCSTCYILIENPKNTWDPVAYNYFSFLHVHMLYIHLSQRNNLQRQQIGEKHVCAKFSREALLSGYVEELNCETRDYKESVHRETPMVCKKFKVSSVSMLNSS